MIGLVILSAPAKTFAQMGDPREKFCIAAEVIGSPNADYTWKTPSGDAVADGTMKRDMYVNLYAKLQLLKSRRAAIPKAI